VELREICHNKDFWTNITSIMDMINPLVETVFLLEGNDSIYNVFELDNHGDIIDPNNPSKLGYSRKANLHRRQ